MLRAKCEELINAITHGVGAVLSVAALIAMIVVAGNYGGLWHLVSGTIYGVSFIVFSIYFVS